MLRGLQGHVPLGSRKLIDMALIKRLSAVKRPTSPPSQSGRRSRAGRLRLGRSSSAGTAKRGWWTSSSWLTAGATASPTPNVRYDFLNIAIINRDHH
jgi:hypothetical protein